MVISSTLDDTLAPPGQHVASLFCQHVAPQLPDGSSWDEHRETVADLMIETVDAHAPNFKRSVLGRQIFSPLDLERTFGLVGGDIFHGALDLGQMFSARPMLGHADYRGPLPGLYMCGSGTHPGGGVTGLPGHNAAREILRDLKRRPDADRSKTGVSSMPRLRDALPRQVRCASLLAIRRIGPRQRAAPSRMRAAEIGRGRVLADLHDAAADRARAREVLEQRVAVAAPDRARELRQVLAEVPSISSTASLLCRNTSRHMVGSEAAMRVKSRKPPAENFSTSERDTVENPRRCRRWCRRSGAAGGW